MAEIHGTCDDRFASEGTTGDDRGIGVAFATFASIMS